MHILLISISIIFSTSSLMGMYKALSTGMVTCPQTDFFRAAYAGNLDSIKQALAEECNIDVQNQKGQTGLHIACQWGHTAIVNFLLRHGADSSITDRDGLTAMHRASIAGYLGCVTALCDHNADPKALDTDLFSPLHFAAISGHASIIQQLITKGAFVHAQTIKRETPLHFAALYGHRNCTRILLRALANPLAQRNDDLFMPLHCAASAGHQDLMSLFAQYKVPMDSLTNNGETALHLAVKEDSEAYLATTKALLSYGASLNICSRASTGDTPTHRAARLQNFNQVELLLGAGADSTIRNSVGISVCAEIVTALLTGERQSATQSEQEKIEKAHQIALTRNLENIVKMLKPEPLKEIKKRKALTQSLVQKLRRSTSTHT